jgi:hypothetical protein
MTGLPASFIHRLRAGKIKNISSSTNEKLSKIYDSYWKVREIKHGVRPDEAASWVKASRPPGYFKKKESSLLAVALKIQAARIARDKTKEEYHSRWHPLTGPEGILSQMARDTSRSADDWTKYVKKVITGGGLRPVRYTEARITQWKADNAKYKRRRRQEARREADRKRR